MFILFNDQLQEITALQVPLTDRGWQYNDGFFETAILQDGSTRYWTDHLDRMRAAAAALQLELPDKFYSQEFKLQLLQLASLEQAGKYGRLKIKVWRAGEGLYTPQTNKCNWMATVAPASAPSTAALQIGICQITFTAYSPLSFFKGPNAPLYVLAGLEKKATYYDDMLLLNQDGYMAELISSNLFWIKEGVLFTPALKSGCVHGIARRNLLRWWQKGQKEVQEVLQKPEELYQAEVVFAANVTGIRGIASINGTRLQQQESLLQKLRQELGFANPYSPS